MSASSPVPIPMTTPTTAKATTTTQPQPTLEPQRRSRDPQHQSRPSHDDELIEDTFKDSNSRCRWSPYWYVTIHSVSCVAFGFTREISGVASRSNSSAAVAELRLPVASFAAAPSFSPRVFSVDRFNLGPRDWNNTAVLAHKFFASGFWFPTQEIRFLFLPRTAYFLITVHGWTDEPLEKS